MSEQPGSRRGGGLVRPVGDPAKALQAHLPWIPITCPPEVVTALQAVNRGDAEPQQQRMVLGWVIEMSRNGGAVYFPGESGRRDTDYALGRAFVGEQLVTILNLKLKRGEQG